VNKHSFGVFIARFRLPTEVPSFFSLPLKGGWRGDSVGLGWRSGGQSGVRHRSGRGDGGCRSRRREGWFVAFAAATRGNIGEEGSGNHDREKGLFHIG